MALLQNLQCNWLLLITISLCWNSVRNEDFLQQFQTEIDQLPHELDTLILHIERNFDPQTETSSTIQPIRVCVQTPDEYLGFWSISSNFDENVDNPPIEIVQSKQCTERDELDKLKLWILQIKNDFFDVLKKPAWSNAYVELKSSYENKLGRYPKNIDEVAKKVISENGKTAISKLRIEYKSVAEKITSFFNRLQNQKRLENEKSADLCVTELIANRIDSAVKILNDIGEERIARQIIVKAYQNEDIFQRLFDFIQLLGDAPATQYAYQGLMMRMASKGYWNHINSLVFLSGIEKLKGSEFRTIANTLRVKLKPFFQTGNYADFFTAVNTRISETADFGQSTMVAFVNGAYSSDIRNTQQILDMQSKFYYMRHKLYLIDSLITEMKIQDHTRKPEFLMVLSDLMALKAMVLTESNESNKKIVSQVYENVPNNLLALLNTNLCIQNAETGEFMHADSAANNGQRKIFTSNQVDETFNFEAEFLDRGRTLIVKNIRFGEYLYVVDGGEPRQLMLMAGNLRNDKRANFAIETEDSTNVRIKNVQFSEFLYSSESSENNGRIVQTKSQTSQDGLWRLTSCSAVK